jgi:hypothetical protein
VLQNAATFGELVADLRTTFWSATTASLLAQRRSH